MPSKYCKYVKFHHVLSFEESPRSVSLFQYFKQHTACDKLILFQDKCLWPRAVATEEWSIKQELYHSLTFQIDRLQCKYTDVLHPRAISNCQRTERDCNLAVIETAF